MQQSPNRRMRLTGILDRKRELKEEADSYMVIVGDFNALFPVMDRKPKIKGTENLNSTTNQPGLKDTCRTAAEDTFLREHRPRSKPEPKPQCRTPRPPERPRPDRGADKHWGGRGGTAGRDAKRCSCLECSLAVPQNTKHGLIV